MREKRREGEGGRGIKRGEEGLLKPQFEERLNSLYINSGVWGHSPTSSADLFLLKEESLTLSQQGKIQVT